MFISCVSVECDHVLLEMLRHRIYRQRVRTPIATWFLPTRSSQYRFQIWIPGRARTLLRTGAGSRHPAIASVSANFINDT